MTIATPGRQLQVWLLPDTAIDREGGIRFTDNCSVEYNRFADNFFSVIGIIGDHGDDVHGHFARHRGKGDHGNGMDDNAMGIELTG